MLKYTKKTLGVTMACAISLAVAGCSGGADSPEETSASVDPATAAEKAREENPGLDLRADLNTDDASITFPYDRYYASLEEQEYLVTATSRAIAACGQAQDVPFEGIDNRFSELYNASSRWGVWTEEMAQRFAFVFPMTDADLVANGIRGARVDDATESTDNGDGPSVELTQEQESILTECEKGPDVRALSLPTLAPAGPWSQPLGDASSQMTASQRAIDAEAALRRCLEARGLQATDEAPLLPEGARGDVIDEDQVRLALTYVDCKNDVKYTEEMASLLADLQAPIIAQYSEELVAQRQRIDEALVKARAYFE